MSAKPKKKCCVSKPRCTRCPLRMLADGTLPAGYTVKRRMLVKVPASAADPTATRAKRHRADPPREVTGKGSGKSKHATKRERGDDKKGGKKKNKGTAKRG